MLGDGRSALTASIVQDRIYAYLCKKNDDDGKPEYRLVLTQVRLLTPFPPLLQNRSTAERRS